MDVTGTDGTGVARVDGIDVGAFDAVVFDIGGVFLLPHPEPIREVLAAGGIEVVDDARRFHRAHYRAVRALAELHVPETDPGFWRAYELTYLEEIGTPRERLQQALAAWLVMREAAVIGVWRWVERHNVAALGRFAAAGVPMAVVSNNDGTAEHQLREFGICQAGPGPLPEVSIVVDSGAVGVAKPDPAIFSPALAALRTDPARTLYVGDMVHADVRGARAAGMAVVQIDPYRDHDGFDHPRAPHLDAVADAVLG